MTKTVRSAPISAPATNPLHQSYSDFARSFVTCISTFYLPPLTETRRSKPRMSLQEQIEDIASRVDIDGNDCWRWTGSPSRGYGRIKVNQRAIQAHRWVYEQLVGPIPQGLELDHLCRVRHCVNPDHLEPVTRKVNLARGQSRFSRRGQTHCKWGHSLEDAYIGGRGQRNCKPCALKRCRERYERLKAAA
jgi:hypothetical protein